MRILFKKCLAIILSCSFIVGLTACGGGTVAVDSSLAKQYVFRGTDIDLGMDFENANINAMEYKNDKLYSVVYEYSWDDETGENTSTLNLLTSDIDAGTTDRVILERKEGIMDMYISQACIANDGKVYGLVETYYMDETNPEYPEYKNVTTLNLWDTDGKLLWEKDMLEYANEGETYIWFRTMKALSDDTVRIFSGNNEYITLDKDGNELGRETIEVQNIENLNNIWMFDDGRVMITTYNNEWTKQSYQTYDSKTGAITEPVEMPENVYSYTMRPGTTTDFILTNSTGVYTYNMGDEAPVQIMDYVNSDIDTSNINNLIMLDNENFVANYYTNTDWKLKLAKFTYVKPEDIPDKKVLSMACFYVDYQVKQDVIEFNKTNTDYRIMITDYSVYNTSENYTAGVEKLNNEIISGNVPDILCLDYNVNVDNYVSKGLFADIKKLIEADEELSQLEYLENVWNAYSIDGKMYQLVSSFNVNSYMAKTSLVGDRAQWTMEEFNEFIKTLPEDCAPFGTELLRGDFLRVLMNYCGKEFVDVETGTCNFNSPQFIAALEFAASLPEEFSEDYWEDYDWTLYESMYRDNKSLLCGVYIYDIKNLNYSIKGQMGEDVTFVGFPVGEGNGSYIQSTGPSFALSARSAYQEGAWQFVRQYITEEYQTSKESTALYGLRVLKSAFEERAKEALERPYWLNDDGEKEYYDNTYYINGEEIILEPFTQEEVDEICNFIYSVNKTSYYDEEIYKIIEEEAGSFFSGAKTAAEVAPIIQSRVQLYVDENR